MYFDSHCHLNFPELRGQLPEIRSRMQAAGVTEAVVVCTTLEEFAQVREVAAMDPHWWCSAGVHPDYHESKQAGMEEPTVERLLALADDPKVVAIGETGLDYYWHKEEQPGALDWQRERFRVHIRAARACGKPLIIHTRNASDDTLRLMREEGADGAGGVMHCFTETWAVAQGALELGFYISFSGIVTFKNAAELRDVAARVPLDRLLIETDAPYLAPVPHRGKTNEPSFVPHVARQIAELRGMTQEAVAELTRENARRLFKRAA
ncbi:MAG TPA: TatD family hydrolase [Burkholderiaceae bacterium]|nr:TatD family hydrolase [Burkholderiaceae bacterium]